MVSIALIGLGAAARNIHMPAYKRLKDRVRVVGACDSDLAARQYGRDQYGIRHVFETPAQMLRAIRADVVAVCTPPEFHEEHVLEALDSRCHVFCEKPLADTLQQADRIVAAAEYAGRLVVVNNQFPYMNIHRAAKARIGSPDFGRLQYLHVWHTMQRTEVTEAGWRGKLVRRLCFEFGIHVFSLVRYMFDDTPSRLLAHMPAIGGSTSDVINVIALEFADGRAASVVLDRVSPGPERYLDMRLDGERAAIHTSIGGELGLTAGVHPRGKRPFIEFRFVKGGKATLQVGSRSTVIARDERNTFTDATAYHFSRFIDALEFGTRPAGCADDNRNTLALVLAAYESAASRSWIEMSRYGAAKPAMV